MKPISLSGVLLGAAALLGLQHAPALSGPSIPTTQKRFKKRSSSGGSGKATGRPKGKSLRARWIGGGWRYFRP